MKYSPFIHMQIVSVKWLEASSLKKAFHYWVLVNCTNCPKMKLSVTLNTNDWVVTSVNRCHYGKWQFLVVPWDKVKKFEDHSRSWISISNENDPRREFPLEGKVDYIESKLIIAISGIFKLRHPGPNANKIVKRESHLLTRLDILPKRLYDQKKLRKQFHFKKGL